MELKAPANVPSQPRPEPAWEVATLFPNQGQWGESDYLTLNGNTNRLIEFSQGQIEVLEMASRTHQVLLQQLFETINQFIRQTKLGQVVIAPYPLRLWEGKFREPDLVLVLAAHAQWLGENFSSGADLVVEILSEDRARDLQTKRTEYAKAGIPEYWIVDPRARTITILQLVADQYVLHQEAGGGQRVESALLPGLSVSRDEIFQGI